MKSFATSICPIKNTLALNMRHPRIIPAPSPRGKTVFYRMLADSGPFSWTSRCSLGAPVGLRHGDLAYRCFRAISAWRSSHLSALRHGDPADRYFRGIPAWRTIPQPISDRSLFGVITGLRHVDLAHRYSSAIPTCRTIQLSLSNRPLTGPRPVFGTATLPPGSSEPSPRGEAVIYRPFGTGTLPTDISEASPRGEPSPNRYQNDFFPVS